jgi:putative ABC transport system permease protein
MEDFPQNSHFHPEFIATPKDKSEFNRMAWTYLLLSDHASTGNILAGFKGFCSSHKELLSAGDKTPSLQKISDIHLHSDKLREIESNGNMSVIHTLAIATILLVFIGITNYVNLNLGMTVFTGKYLQVTSVFGASGWTNVKYFLCEGMVIAVISLIMSGSISAFGCMIIQKHFGLDLSEGSLPLTLVVLASISLLTILSGILFLFRQGIGQMQFFPGSKNRFNRKGISKSLIVVQYTISISLMVTVLVIYRQTNYALESSMGAQADNLICFENVQSSIQSKFEVFKSELLKYNSIGSVSASLDPPGGEANDMFAFTLEGYVRDETKKEDNLIGILPCDYSFAKTFDLIFLSGTNFSETNEDHEGAGEYIINESAMRRLHYTDPDQITGKEFSLAFDSDVARIPKGRIIGVVKDFYLSSMKKPVEPLVMFKRKNLWLLNFVVSIRPGMQTTGLHDIEHVWKRLFPDHAFQYNYVRYIYRNIYQEELLQARLLSIFTFVALVVSAMGLLGMSLLTAQRRMKEIAIRKVNGAKVSQIMTLLNWDFVKWIMISFAIAVPLAFFAMKKWLENFAYKTTISWWIFALAGMTAILLVLITISVQSWKAATRNPVETLRHH